MAKLNWRFIAELVGITAIVASLIFVGVQIQQDRQVAFAQANMSALEASLAVRAAIAENADVWAKARNSEALNDAEFQVMESLIEMASDRAYFRTLSSANIAGRSDSETFRETSGPISTFSTLLFDNPGARKIWNERADRQQLYAETLGRGSGAGANFRRIVRSHLAKLDRLESGQDSQENR